MARWAANAGALWVASLVIRGIELEGWQAVLASAAIFTGVGLVVWPLAIRLSCPLQCLTLGLFTWVVSAAMLALTAWLSGQFAVGFSVDGPAAAFLGAPLVGIVSFVFERVLR
ncbi:MAG: phage holin family protein [Dehalococcoidia bacterium]